jgi:3-oxoacyl-[acyl-carrier protein] reductase
MVLAKFRSRSHVSDSCTNAPAWYKSANEVATDQPKDRHRGSSSYLCQAASAVLKSAQGDLRMGILDGKVGIVTGSGRGIGRGHCLYMAEAGASIVVNDVDLEEARKVVAEIEGKGGKAIANSSDISERSGAEELVAQCLDEFGRLDAMVNNAGIARDRSLLKMSDEEFDSVLRVHLRGTFLCGQLAARQMKEQGSGGAIVNTTSGAQYGNFGQTNYSAAKGGISSMTYTWAVELARHAIRVNAIAPLGSTRMSATAKVDGVERSDAPFVDPTLNGPFVAYLCSDEADWITGQVFGSGGERVQIVEQPRYGSAMLRPGGWQIDDIREHMKRHFGNRLEDFGIFKRPYAFYDGIKTKPAE